MSRHVLDACSHIEHLVSDVAVRQRRGGGDASPHVDLFTPRVLLLDGVAERTRNITHRRAGTIRDDVGHLGRMFATVTCVHVLNDLFASSTLNVDVDVRRTIAFRREKAFKQQPQRHGVGLGDAKCVTHCAVCCTAPALAQNRMATTELDDVPHHQEVTGKAECLYDLQLMIDGRPCSCTQRQVLSGGRTRAVTSRRTVAYQLA